MSKYIKLYYLLVATINGVFATAMPIYYQNLSFTSYQIGILIAIPSIAMLFQPIWGMLVDKYGIAKQIGIVGTICSSLVLLLLLFVHSFPIVLIVVALYSFIKAPVWSSIDNIIITYCMNNNLNYGPFRVFASAAWGSSLLIFLPFALLFGFKAYFVLNFAVSIFVAYMISRLPQTTQLEDSKVDLGKDATFKDGIKHLAHDKSFYFIVIFTFFFSTLFVTNLNYQALYFEALGQSSLFISVAMFISILPELIILPFVEKISNKYNPISMLMLVVLCYLIKYIGFAVTTSIPILLVLTAFHGIGMSFYIPIFIKLLKSSVPNNVSTTAITVNSFVAAIAGILMSLTAGYISGQFGIHSVFYLNAIMLVCAMIVLILFKYSSASDYLNKA